MNWVLIVELVFVGFAAGLAVGSIFLVWPRFAASGPNEAHQEWLDSQTRQEEWQARKRRLQGENGFTVYDYTREMLRRLVESSTLENEDVAAYGKRVLEAIDGAERMAIVLGAEYRPDGPPGIPVLKVAREG